MLGYRPRYGSIEAVCESVSWLIEKGIVQGERETAQRSISPDKRPMLTKSQGSTGVGRDQEEMGTKAG
jgi:hypothetical protein